MPDTNINYADLLELYDLETEYAEECAELSGLFEQYANDLAADNEF